MTFDASGDSLPELFTNAAHSLLPHLINPADVGRALREKVVVEAPSREQLLQAWLTSLLNLVRIQRMVFNEVQVQELRELSTGSWSLRAEVLGELIDVHRHSFLQSEKQLTCQRAQIAQQSQGYRAKIEII